MSRCKRGGSFFDIVIWWLSLAIILTASALIISGVSCDNSFVSDIHSVGNRREQRSLRNRELSSSDTTGENTNTNNLALRDWLLVEENINNQQSSETGGNSGLLVRRITPKSVFVAPSFNTGCSEGYKQDNMGRCIKLVKVNQAAQLEFLLQKLNSMYAAPNINSNKNVNKKETNVNNGPFHVSLPLGGVQNNKYNNKQINNSQSQSIESQATAATIKPIIIEPPSPPQLTAIKTEVTNKTIIPTLKPKIPILNKENITTIVLPETINPDDITSTTIQNKNYNEPGKTVVELPIPEIIISTNSEEHKKLINLENTFKRQPSQEIIITNSSNSSNKENKDLNNNNPENDKPFVIVVSDNSNNNKYNKINNNSSNNGNYHLSNEEPIKEDSTVLTTNNYEILNLSTTTVIPTTEQNIYNNNNYEENQGTYTVTSYPESTIFVENTNNFMKNTNNENSNVDSLLSESTTERENYDEKFTYNNNFNSSTLYTTESEYTSIIESTITTERPSLDFTITPTEYDLNNSTTTIIPNIPNDETYYNIEITSKPYEQNNYNTYTNLKSDTTTIDPNLPTDETESLHKFNETKTTEFNEEYNDKIMKLHDTTTLITNLPTQDKNDNYYNTDGTTVGKPAMLEVDEEKEDSKTQITEGEDETGNSEEDTYDDKEFEDFENLTPSNFYESSKLRPQLSTSHKREQANKNNNNNLNFAPHPNGSLLKKKPNCDLETIRISQVLNGRIITQTSNINCKSELDVENEPSDQDIKVTTESYPVVTTTIKGSGPILNSANPFLSSSYIRFPTISTNSYNNNRNVYARPSPSIRFPDSSSISSSSSIPYGTKLWNDDRVPSSSSASSSFWYPPTSWLPSWFHQPQSNTNIKTARPISSPSHHIIASFNNNNNNPPDQKQSTSIIFHKPPYRPTNNNNKDFHQSSSSTHQQIPSWINPYNTWLQRD